MMNAVVALLRNLTIDDRGQDLIEYSLLGGLIALALVAVTLGILSGAITDMFTGIGNCINFDGLNCT